MKYAVAFDSTTVVGESIKDVLQTLVEAVLLVIVVIYLFLQDWRSTFIPAITIPVSLIGTFIFVKLFGFSINTLTLFGITLATGLVVDDAIVVIENVERHITEGITEPHNAASVAMKEVAGAVIATSLVLVAVFVPVALFPGTTGILFRQFALTIAFSVSISAFNALTLTPALSAIFLGHHRERAQGAFFRAFNRGVEWVTEAYRTTVRHVIGWRFAALLVFVGVLGATYWVYQIVPRAFIPEDDQGFIMFIIQAPQGASLTYTRDICAKVEQVLAKTPEIAAAFTVAGFSQAGNAPNRAIIYANLQAIRPSQGRRAFGAGGDSEIARPVVRDSRRTGGAVQSAGGAGLGTIRRLLVSARGSGSQFPANDREYREHPGGARQRQRKADRPVHQLYGERSAISGAHRSRKSEEPASSLQPDHRRAPGLHGLGVRERFRFQQSVVSRVRAGGSKTSGRRRKIFDNIICGRTPGR